MSPEPASYDPEEFVDGSQPWPRLLALKDGELVTKGEVFEHQAAVRPKPAKHGSEPEPKQVKHGNQVIADRLCRLPCEVVDFTAGQDCDEGQGVGRTSTLQARIEWKRNGKASRDSPGSVAPFPPRIPCERDLHVENRANIPQAANRCLCNIEHFADAVLSRMLQAPHSSQIFTGAYGFRPCEYGEGRPLFSRCFRIATA